MPECVFSARPIHQSNAILAATQIEDGAIVLAGRGGTLVLAEPRSGQFIRQQSRLNSDIHSLANVGRGLVAAGTADGLAILDARTNSAAIRSPFGERVQAVSVTNWGGRERAIVTGSADGAIRRWTMAGAGGLNQLRDGVTNREYSKNKLGRSVQCMIPWGGNVLAAVDNSLVVLNESFAVTQSIDIDRRAIALCAISGTSVVAVGNGFICVVNVPNGSYGRMLSVSPKTEYVAVAKLTDRTVVAGTKDGKVRAIDVNSGTEVGEIDLAMSLRGLLVNELRIYAFGGDWKSVSNSVFPLDWKLVYPDQ